MILEIGILIGIALLLGLGIWLSYRFLKKRKIKESKIRNMPESILEEFNLAEEMMKGGNKEDGKQPNPYSVLYTIAKTSSARDDERRNRGAKETKQPSSDGQLYEQSIRREVLQDGNVKADGRNNNRDIRTKISNRKSIISRIRSRAKPNSKPVNG